MRKTNKKLSKLVDDKSGVILVTVIFIVAMALVFITTALTIAIANRQRVYTNAKSDQARLTVTSLSQSIWQAVYSQQINDDMLYSLAKGSTGNGSLVTFTCSDIPGMTGTTGTTATAYFYLIQEENLTVTPKVPRKIGVECRCEIDGESQYYTLVLQKNNGEGLPPASFNTLVELGNGGVLNSCNFGVNVDYITNNDRDNQVAYDAADNVVFLHAPSRAESNNDGLGIYSTLITDGTLAFGDVVFARDTYFLGPDAGYVFGLNGNQTNPALRNTAGATYLEVDGSGNVTARHGTPQYGNLYFWGTNSPFYLYSWPGTTSAITTETAPVLKGANNLYFDRADDGHGNLTGFGSTTFRQSFVGQFFDNNTVVGNVYYEGGITVNYSGLDSVDPTFHDQGANYAPVSSTILGYRTPGDYVDTIGEVSSQMLPRATALTAVNIDTSSDLTAMTGGHTYYFNDNITVTSQINVNLGSGNVYIVIADGKELRFGGNGWFNVYGGGDQSEFYIFLLDGASVKIGTTDGNNPSDGSCSGIVDQWVYETGTTDYTDVHNLNQSKIPRCRILSTYLGGTQVSIYSNHKGVLTAMLGLYSNAAGAAGGGEFFVRTPGTCVYYGRIACGGIDVPAGNTLNIPYCPSPTAYPPGRDSAYRDNTDYSVVTAECGYFTA